MTEADIIEFRKKTLPKEVEKLQEVLKPFGYEVQGIKRKRRYSYDFVLRLSFVGSSVFAGEDSGISSDGNNTNIRQNLCDVSHGTE